MTPIDDNAAVTGMTVDEVLTIARIVLRLGEVERIPLHPDGARRETDTTHTVMLALVAAQMATRLGLDPGAAALLALVHDLPEVYAGDTDTSLGLTAAQRTVKDEQEAMAFDRLHTELGCMWQLRNWLEAYHRPVGSRLHEQAPVVRTLVALLDKAMPKIVRIIEREAQGLPAPAAAFEQAATRQALELLLQHGEQVFRPVHLLSANLRARLFAPTPDEAADALTVDAEEPQRSRST